MPFLKKYFVFNFPVGSFLFWIAIGLLFPLAGGNVSLTDIAGIGIFFFAAVCLGQWLFSKSVFLQDIPPLLQTGLSFIAGGCICFIAVSVIPHRWTVPAIALVFLCVATVNRLFRFDADLKGLAAAVPAGILLLYREELLQALSSGFITTNNDYFFYEAIVVSLSKLPTIFDCIFHRGAPVNYATLPFFTPAALSFSSGVGPHVAYMGVYVPILKMLCFAMIAASAVHAFRMFRNDNKDTGWTYYAGASLGLLLLAPLHPQYLAAGDHTRFIFFGEGYILPLTSMGFAMGCLWFGTCNFFVFRKGRHTAMDITLFVLFTALIAASKQAFYYPVLFFYGSYYLFIAFRKKQYAGLGYVVLAAAAGWVVTKIFTGNDGGMTQVGLASQGSYSHYFRLYAEKFRLPGTVTAAIGLFMAVIVLWFGFKIVLFAAGYIKQKGDIRYFIAAAVITGLVFLLPGWLVEISYVDEQKNVLAHGTIDTMQFSANGLFISTFAGLCCLLLLWNELAGRTRALFRIAAVCWMGLAGLCLTTYLFTRPVIVRNSWEEEVVMEYRKTSPGLMAMLSMPSCSGQVLVAKGVTPWYICSRRCDFWGSYLFTLQPNYRNRLLEELYAASTTADKKRSIIEQLKRENVDALVATPHYKASFDQLEALDLIGRKAGIQWIYHLK